MPNMMPPAFVVKAYRPRDAMKGMCGIFIATKLLPNRLIFGIRGDSIESLGMLYENLVMVQDLDLEPSALAHLPILFRG